MKPIENFLTVCVRQLMCQSPFPSCAKHVLSNLIRVLTRTKVERTFENLRTLVTVHPFYQLNLKSGMSYVSINP